MTAQKRLVAALRDAPRARLRVPCVGSDGWLSDSAHERSRAALACVGCPLLALCAAAADELDESFAVWGVWGGADRGRTTRETRRKAS